MSATQFSLKRLFVSTTLLAIGFALAVVGFRELGGFSHSMSDNTAFALWFLGVTLIGAGALCPFHRTVSGALTGFALCLLNFFIM